MSSKHANVIWEGRFQPIHLGHVAYVRRLLEHAERVWVFVVDNERSTEANPPIQSPVPDFTAIVDQHHVPQKNPLPFWLRYRLVQETLQFELGSDAPITVWGGRRLDFAWPFYARALPKERVFLTPKRDDFEDAKAAAWQALGETVVRIDIAGLPVVSATMVRESAHDRQRLEQLLSPKTLAILEQEGYLGALTREADGAEADGAEADDAQP